MITHSSILAWRIPWTEGPGGLQSMRSEERRVGKECVCLFISVPLSNRLEDKKTTKEGLGLILTVDPSTMVSRKWDRNLNKSVVV